MQHLAVDLFCGLGGFSEGAKAAKVKVTWCANHWKEAVAVHRKNHPEAVHACQDLNQADWTTLPRHSIGLASPACQGHSKARGKERAHHDACRSTAWAVVSCAEVHWQDCWVVENVPEFLEWRLYPAWESAMRTLGYSLAPHIIDAADLGVPQHRRRVFIVCTRSKAPIRLKLPKLPHVAVDGCLDRKSTKWSPVVDKVAATKARITAGRAVHGDRFLMAYYGNEKGGRSVHRPLGTVTTHDRYALVEGSMMRMLTAQEYRRIMGFPETYHLPAGSTLAKHMLGNAVCPPVATALLKAVLEQV